MTQNNITDIEKAARMIGIEASFESDSMDGRCLHCGEFWAEYHDHPTGKCQTAKVPTGFNPRTNKADLMDVETELGIDITFYGIGVSATTMPPRVLGETFIRQYGRQISVSCNYADHPTKFAARAEAVMSVVSQLYDAKFGKDGE